MPNNYDFSNLNDVKEILIHPQGWVNPLIVEYGQGYPAHSETQSYHWRVKGTKHTFVIPVVRMNFITEGKYETHFEEALEGFREDYKGWAEEGWYADWMQAYREDFSRFIAL